MPTVPSVDLNSLLELLSYNNKVVQVTSPNPPPPLIKPLSKTSFQVSPFLEKNLLDPYKTSTLVNLTKADLAIDNIVDYLQNLLPPELIDEISKDVAFAQQLIATGLTINQAVNDLISQLNSGSLLQNLLRNLPISSLINLLPSFLRSIANAGLNGLILADAFYVNGLIAYNSFSGLIDNLGYENNYTSFTSINNVNQTDYSTVTNPVADASVVLAIVSTMAYSNTSYLHYLNSISVNNSVTLLPLVNNISSSQFATLANGVQMLGISSSTQLVNIVNIIATIGQANLTILTNLLSAHNAPITNLSSYINVFGLTDMNSLYSCLLANGTTNTNTIITTINTFTSTNVYNVLNIVKAVQVSGYLLTDSSGTYTSLLNLVNTYGINTVFSMAYVVFDITASTLSTIIGYITTVTLSSFNSLLTLANTYTPNVINTIVLELNSISSTILNGVIANINLIETNGDLTSITAFGTLSVTNTAALSSVLLAVDTNIVLVNITNLNSLSAANIVNISTQISNYEPYTTISNFGISGLILNYTVRLALETSAKAGNYNMLLNILNNYSGIITQDYRKYLVNTLLKNYVFTTDDAVSGVSLAGKYLVQALNSIYSGWYTDVRSGETVYTQLPFLNASNDALMVLSNYAYTEIPAIFQIDNNYILSL